VNRPLNSVGSEVLGAPAGPLVVAPYAASPAIVLSLVVPTLNERETIGEFLLAVRDVLDAALPGRHEVVVLDDDSPDGTWEAAAALMPGYPGLRVVRRQGERGLACAVIRGWQVAAGSILGTINADFQHPPSVLARMIEKTASAEVVVASRYADGGGLGDWGLLRRLSSRSAHGFGRLLLPSAFGRTTDPLSGCYMFRRSGIAGVELKPLGFKTLIEILVRGNFDSVADCSYEMRERLRGRSKASPRHSLEYLRHLFRLRAAAREMSRR
jgi:dolichol-phosphate mannosyltransferase